MLMWWWWIPETSPGLSVGIIFFVLILFILYKIDKSGGCLKLFVLFCLCGWLVSTCKSCEDYEQWDKERTEKLDEMARKRKKEMEERNKDRKPPKIVPPSELPK